MANIQMEVIPEPKQGTASVLVPSPNGPQIMFKGSSSDNYICGACGKTICQNVNRGMFINLVFKCFECGSFNRVRGT
jgi:DNA-directed RNA polymerase subunit RPC12/RpoP